MLSETASELLKFAPGGVHRSLRSATRQAKNLLLPPACMACNGATAMPDGLCQACWSGIRFIEKPWCAVLGSPFSYELGDGVLSAGAIANPPSFDRARSVMLYDDAARRLVRNLKFSDRTDLAPGLAGWMARFAERAGEGMLQADCLIVPVPLHWRRLLQRRYNQSAELARNLAKGNGLAYRPELLTRIRPTRQQVGLGRKERLKNVGGAFRVPIDQKADLAGRTVVLIDDVFTTGATLDACARALRRAGAARIDCLTLARVAPGDM